MGQTPTTFRGYKNFLTRRIPFHAAAPNVPEILLHHTTEYNAVRFATEKDPLLSKNYSLAAWPGGIWLARYILDHPSEFEGKRILDLGTGSGIVAIALAKVGAHVTARDDDMRAIYAARINAAKNGVKIKFEYVMEDDSSGYENFDVITTGDTLYNRPFIELLYILVQKYPLTIYLASGSSATNADEINRYLNPLPRGVTHELLQTRTREELADALPTAIKIISEGNIHPVVPLPNIWRDFVDRFKPD